jgi:hypothetical protein
MKFGNAGTPHDGAQRFIRLLKNGASSHDPALRGSCKCSHISQYAARSKSPRALTDGPMFVFQHPAISFYLLVHGRKAIPETSAA